MFKYFFYNVSNVSNVSLVTKNGTDTSSVPDISPNLKFTPPIDGIGLPFAAANCNSVSSNTVKSLMVTTGWISFKQSLESIDT